MAIDMNTSINASKHFLQEYIFFNGLRLDLELTVDHLTHELEEKKEIYAKELIILGHWSWARHCVETEQIHAILEFHQLKTKEINEEIKHLNDNLRQHSEQLSLVLQAENQSLTICNESIYPKTTGHPLLTVEICRNQEKAFHIIYQNEPKNLLYCYLDCIDNLASLDILTGALQNRIKSLGILISDEFWIMYSFFKTLSEKLNTTILKDIFTINPLYHDWSLWINRDYNCYHKYNLFQLFQLTTTFEKQKLINWYNQQAKEDILDNLESIKLDLRVWELKQTNENNGLRSRAVTI